MAQPQDRVADAAVDRGQEERRAQPAERQDGLETVARHEVAPGVVEPERVVESLDGPVEAPSAEGVERQRGVGRRAGGQGVMERQVEDTELSVPTYRHRDATPARSFSRILV